MKHHFCLYSDCSCLFQQELCSSQAVTHLLPLKQGHDFYPLIKAVTHLLPLKQGRHFYPLIKAVTHLLPLKQEHHLYSGCYPPVTQKQDFDFYVVTCSYSSHPFLCALGIYMYSTLTAW